MQSKTHRLAVVTSTTTMDEDKQYKSVVRRPDVLRKLNTENLLMIERGLLGDLPDRFKPQPPVPVRGRPSDLTIAKPNNHSFLSACLPVALDSPGSVTPSDDEATSPLKKSFSFREKFSRLSFLSKSRDKNKWKTIAEDEKTDILKEETFCSKMDQENKASKRFWFFRSKEIERRDKSHAPMYKRSKSFEFLPRAIEEEKEGRYIERHNSFKNIKNTLKNSQSFVYGSSDTMGEAWVSNDSLEFVSPSPPIGRYIDHNDDVFPLDSIKESASDSSKDHGSSQSTITSGNSSGGINILQRGSVQDLLDEFDRTIELFSESYLSDCEPYTKSGDRDLTVNEKRKSTSFSTLPSPKVVQLNPMKVSVISEDFKRELSVAISAKRAETPGSNRSSRRGSVTDWFVLEENAPDDKYRRAQAKPTKRVRRMSSTKYWITPEECAVYTREQRPPLVIPRISQFRGQRALVSHNHNIAHSYPEETFQEPSVKSSVRQYDRLPEWSPTPDRYELDQYSKASSDSPRAIRVMTRNRLAGSTENLLMRRPNQLHLPASSSGDSLDIEVREKEPVSTRSRKSKSMVAPKHRMRSPVPAPRMLLHNQLVEPGSLQASVVQEGPVKRTKFSESGKKCKKNWNECYMLLTQTALYFYKDQRTYYATKIPKPPGTPPSPTAPRAELVLALKNAHVVQCIQMHTRRHSRSLVLTVGYDQYLLQDDTEEGAKRWLSRIQNVIYKLGPPTQDDYPTPQSQSSNTDLESIGRTPPPSSRHPHRAKQKAGDSSIEDLSDDKSHVRSRLRKFFAKRPAMEVLVKKGIYKDEPVFGRNLEEVCPSEPGRPRVPDFVVNCVNEIERDEENMCTDGLYRASGNLSQVQKIRLEIDQNNMHVIQNNPDIHVLTGSLKLFFRELKEPLIPCNIFDRVLSACSVKPREARVKEFRDIVNALPQCNRDTLKYLLEHLLRVTQYSERNRMHTANLAIVFGPTLLWAPAEQAHNIAVDCIQQNNVVDILLTDFKEIFAEDINKSKKKA